MPGIVQISTFTRPDNAEALAAKLDHALTTFAAEGITEAERQRALAILRGRELYTLQAPASRVSEVLWARDRGLSPDFSREVLEAASALTLDALDAFVADFFRPDQFVAARVVPAPP
ncbi:MAG: hypothetical protein R3F59_25710 [Myxococcota bacterium]